MPNLYIHIGIMKTGTSSIQKFLAGNREALKKQGYVFPRTSQLLPSFYNNRNGYFMVYHDSRETNDENKIKMWKHGWDIVEKEMEKGNHIILSDESIWYRQFWETFNGRPFWENVKEKAAQYGYSVKVISYIRRQDLFVESYWNTAVRGDTRTKLRFEEYVREKRYEFCEITYDKQVKRMIEDLGREAVCIRPFEKSQFEGRNQNLISDFLKYTDIDYTDDFKEVKDPSNIATTGNFLEMKRLINQITAYPNYHNFLRFPIERASETDYHYADEKEKVGFFSYEQRVDFLKEYEEGNIWIAKEILGREDGILFYEEMKDLTKWENPYDRATEDIIRVMGEIACSQYVQIQRLNARIEELEKHRGLTSRLLEICHKILRKLKK